MLRRKLALLTLLYIAGITAGFLISEKDKIIEAACFIGAVFAAVCFTDPGNDPGRGFVCEDTSKDSTGIRPVLLLIFVSGIAVFMLRSQLYDSSAVSVKDLNHITGKVISASLKNDKVNLTVRNTEGHPSKVLVILDKQTVLRSADHGKYDEDSDLREAASSYIGSYIEARGEYEEPAPSDNPGCFDYRLYMRSKGICVQLRAYIVENNENRASLTGEAQRFLYKTREAFLDRFDDDTKGFIRGVIFGDKSELDEEMLEGFNLNSTGHILAVSGLHIGFLYGLLKVLTGRKRSLSAALLISGIILVYGEMTMWSPSTVRAVIVMSVSLFSIHFRRRADLLTSVSFAAFILLTYEPYQLFNSGFQMSFLALCGIAFLSGPLSTITGDALAVMLAVQIGTLPVIAYSFCRINPLAILINVPVILLSSVLVPLCILLLMLEVVFGMVPSAGISIAELISYAVITVNRLLNFGGGFSIRTAGPGIAAMIAIYVFVFGASSEWVRVMLLRKDSRHVVKQAVLLLMPIIMLSACFYDRIADDEIIFVSVGQGDCTQIKADSHNVLIDGGGLTDYGSRSENGSKAAEGYNVGKKVLMPYLLHNGVSRVDLALVTHLHADHYKGILELSEIYPVGAIGIPADYRGAENISNLFDHSDDTGAGNSSDSGVISETFYIKPDTKVDIAEQVSVEVIWPMEIADEPLSADDPNEHNTVYMISYEDVKVMVTGDLLEEDERKMVDYYEGSDVLKCDILKVAHHGSKSSSCEEFLDAASPKIAVIECGRNNFYGHPHKQTLDRLKERGIKVFRTDISGTVGIDIRRGKILVDLYRHGPMNTDAAGL